jgi:acetyl esterase
LHRFEVNRFSHLPSVPIAGANFRHNLGMAEFDPDIAAWQGAIYSAALSPTLDELRAGHRDRNAALYAEIAGRYVPAATEDAVVAGLAARVYRPAVAGPVPTIVYFHGGGWVLGGLDTHRGVAERLCVQAGAVVVAVAYRRAPEHAFPAAFDDCHAAAVDIAARSSEFGAGPLVVAGDSAGAQLALSVAMASRSAGPAIAAQLLFYPVTDVGGAYRLASVNARYPSRVERAEGFGLTTLDMTWFVDQYAPIEDDWRASPLRGELAGLPPTVIHTASFDPLRDEGNALAAALVDAGVAVVHREFDSLPHSYLGYGGVSPAAEAAASMAALDLGQLLGARQPG